MELPLRALTGNPARVGRPATVVAPRAALAAWEGSPRAALAESNPAEVEEGPAVLEELPWVAMGEQELLGQWLEELEELVVGALGVALIVLSVAIPALLAQTRMVRIALVAATISGIAWEPEEQGALVWERPVGLISLRAVSQVLVVATQTV